jgi:hypothetical protein
MWRPTEWKGRAELEKNLDDPSVTKLTVHLCVKCGVQTIWTPDGPLHENDTTDHLADPGRTLVLDWDPESSVIQITSDMGGVESRPTG